MNKIPLRPTRFFALSHLSLFFGLFLWFSPWTHALCVEGDRALFYLFNGTLHHRPHWQSFWALLNHRQETAYNLVLALCLNLWAVAQTKGPKARAECIKRLVYFWFCFEIVFCLQEYFFHDFLKIIRQSPSLVLKPSLRLSEVLQDPQIKDASRNCFPGGHAFALLYWALFSLHCSPRRIGILGILFALFLCLPRLFSGAHWMSDTLFSALLASVCFAWTVLPLYFWQMRLKK